MNQSRKALLSLFFFNLSYVLYAVLPSHHQYDISIYNQIPLAGLFFGALILMISIYNLLDYLMNDDTFCDFPHSSAIIIFGSTFIMLLLPLILGYNIHYGDVMTHSGDAVAIIQGGGIPQIGASYWSAINYPNLHIFTSQIAIVTSMKINKTFLIFRGVQYSIFFFFILAVSNKVAGKNGIALSLIFTPYVIHRSTTLVAPSTLVYLTIFPLIILLLFESQDESPFSIAILSITVGFSMWGYHQFAPIAITGVLILSYLINSIPRDRVQQGIFVRPVVLVYFCISGFAWFMYMTKINLVKISGVLATSLGIIPTEVQQRQTTGSLMEVLFDQLGFSLIDVFLLFIKRFGSWAVLLSISIFIILVLREREGLTSVPNVALITSIVLALGELLIGIIPAVTFQRILRLGVVVSPIIIASYRWDGLALEKLKIRKYLKISLMIVLTFVLLLSFANMYSSPWIVSQNQFVTDSEVDGWAWYFEHKNRDLNTTTLSGQTSRYVDYLFKPEVRESRSKELQYTSSHSTYRPPPHYGLKQNTNVKESLGYSYYLDSQRGRATYTSKNLADFNSEDISRINSDSTSNKIYSNSNLRVYLIS